MSKNAKMTTLVDELGKVENLFEIKIVLSFSTSLSKQCLKIENKHKVQ